jgi:hypothetical protein
LWLLLHICAFFRVISLHRTVNAIQLQHESTKEPIMAKEVMVNFRLSPEEKRMFYDKAKKVATPSIVLRELVKAFADDRITVVIHNPIVKGN